MKLQEKVYKLNKVINEEMYTYLQYNTQDKITLINIMINRTIDIITYTKIDLYNEHREMINKQADLFSLPVESKKYIELKETLEDFKLELEALYYIKYVQIIKEEKL